MSAHQDGASCYADHVWHGQVVIGENVSIARDTHRLRFICPEIARRIVPGQFLMLRFPGSNDPLLGRPLALYDVVSDDAGAPHALDIVYTAVGRMTRLLALREPGSQLEVWGPLGNGFPVSPTEHLLMVAGGIGQTPFMALAREYFGRGCFGDPPRAVPAAQQITLCYGVRNKDYLAGVDDFRKLGVDVRLSTEDGSAGHHGLVTDLIGPAVLESRLGCRVVCCGPEAMIKATTHVAHGLGLHCQVSLESPMACGVGVCFSCVVRIRDEQGQWDYRRTCVEGPIFDAQDVEF